MAVPDILRNVTRNIKEALSSREGFKEKAKDLPLYVLQSALSGMGQALRIGDRMRTSIKHLADQEENAEESRREAAGSEKATESVETEEKPARREPVIFAPRPESTPVKETAPEVNGSSSRPEPVIFAPTKPKATGPEPTAAEAPDATATSKAAEAGDSAEAAKAKPAEAVETAQTEPAEAVETAQTEPAEAAEAEAGIPSPAAVQVEVAEVEIVESAAAEPVAVPAEPMPGYGQLTVASLRARMRGKSAEQIQELLDYEQATTARPEVVRMYGNRLAKLGSAE
ncbi:chemotaxis protein histidine kinase CheA [Streptosporangium album]|uniref:Chemotaxis protein histidine kinase CheA n=1 Tax=Streptosporangium album TaxID=47479 RepID=A0A7W7RSQ6_9ACTN|nr:hypothetical protein [Streptosporangium album]MBB4937505.1 chemotaxis protein histidine kinase CheA [Streptosporangium album]